MPDNLFFNLECVCVDSRYKLDASIACHALFVQSIDTFFGKNNDTVLGKIGIPHHQVVFFFFLIGVVSGQNLYCMSYTQFDNYNYNGAPEKRNSSALQEYYEDLLA